MKNLFIPFSRQFVSAIIATLALITASSCKTTVTSGPPTRDSLSTSSEQTYAKPKERSRRFKKKPGDAQADFQKDNRNGRLKLKQYGIPGPLTPYYNKLLTNELGINIEVISTGMLTPDMLRYAKEYNALMTGAIQKKYGPDILLEARRRALILKAQVDSGSLQ